MAKKFSLAEFLPQTENVSDSDPMTIREIPLPKIIANGRNFYGVRDVEELAESIKVNGLLEPLIVYRCALTSEFREMTGHPPIEMFRVISGHRRLAALQMNKAETALCRVVDKPESAAREDLLIINANAQRVKTGAEQAAEAERMTAALVALKKEGVELPGRLRDMVADAMGTSSTALARKRVIQKQLAVPGFKQAWESGKMGETVAYELARMPEKDQYAALDLLIDAGVDYKTADIKTVQRIKKQIEAGESTKQELHIEAEKRGVKIRDEDFSPLLAELVAEAIPESWQAGLRRCRTKAAGLEHLRRFGFGHHSRSGAGVCYDSDPQALTITQPIRRRIKWSDVWELLALGAMNEAAETGTSSAPDGAPSPQGEGMGVAEILPEWRTGNPTREGRYICRAVVGGADKEFTACRWKDGGWWVFDRPAISGFEVTGWWPLPDEEKEGEA